MGTLWNQYHLIKQSITIMFSILVLSCLVLPAVLANDPPCTRCCNLEATVLESTVRLVQCEKDVVDCPEEQNTVTEYLPEYMRCLTKSKKRVDVSVDPDCQYHCHAGHCSTTCGRDGRSMQFILGLLRGNTASPGGGSGGSDSDDSEGSDNDSDASDSDASDSDASDSDASDSDAS